MGPTGAGKSSFIEALGLKGSSKISSNGLDGCTQAVSTYKLNNVVDVDGDAIYLVDSPGFADTKISEMAIVSMLQKWLQDNDTTRMPGSQRQVLKTFHALTGVETAKNVTIVTTMWDTIGGEHGAKRAEESYQQLQGDIWKEFIEGGAKMTQFHNKRKSALSVLDQASISFIGENFSVEDHQENFKGSPFEANLLTDLQDRIQNLQSHIPTLHDELAHAEAQGDQLLLSTLRPRIQEAEADLAQFQKELKDFHALPTPSPASSEDEDGDMSDNEEDSYEEEVTYDHNDAEPDIEAEAEAERDSESEQSDGEQHDLAGGHSIIATRIQPASVTPTSLVAPLIPNVSPTPEFLTPPTLPVEEQCVALADNPPSLALIRTDSRPIVREMQATLQGQLAPPARAPGRLTQVMKKFKCWGDATAELHET